MRASDAGGKKKDRRDDAAGSSEKSDPGRRRPPRFAFSGAHTGRGRKLLRILHGRGDPDGFRLNFLHQSYPEADQRAAAWTLTLDSAI
jgi:hypothetical protein